MSREDSWKIRVLNLSPDRKGVFCYSTRERAWKASLRWAERGYRVIVSGFKVAPILRAPKVDSDGRIRF